MRKTCTGALADLTNSYSAFTDPADVASCTLSQNNVEGRLIAYNRFDCAKRQSPLISTLAGCTPDMIDPYQ